MRKFLSILMLACLLCGLALPAAAEGELPLYAQVGEGTDYQTSLTFEAGQTLTARFYTGNTADSPVIPDGTFTSAPEGLTIGTPDTAGNRALSAAAAGTYTVSCVRDEVTYQMAVTVTPPETPSTTNTIPVPDAAKLTEILADQTKFDTFLTENHYSGSGDLTLVLPAGTLGSVTCGVQLSNGAKLILKGAADKKTNFASGMTISAPNVSLDGIKVTDSITVDPSYKLEVSNCAFDCSAPKYAFLLKQDAGGKVSILSLTNNTFSSNRMASIIKNGATSADDVLGKWLAQPGTKPNTENIDFGARIVEEEGEALHITFSSSKSTHVNNGWNFSFITNCNYSDAYVVYSRKKGIYKLENKQITIGAHTKGEYTVVNGSYPTLDKKNGYYEVKVTDKHKKYLDEVTLDNFPYAAANITLGGQSVDYSMSTVGGKRSVTIPKISVGTYTIKETTKTVTKTVTKTTTTSRKYSTTYQDYFLVTPKGFSNAMRYVKDNLVTLNCTEAGRRPVSLPVASMREAAEKGYSVLVKTKNAELTMDPAALKSMAQQAKGTTVLLHYKSLNHKTMSGVGQSSVESHVARNPSHVADLAFLVTATSENETIEDLQQGSVQLKIPFIVLPGTEDKGNTVYALQSETVTEDRETVVADGYLTTKLLDLTEHMVFQIGEPMETTAETTEETTEETTVETTEETTEPETEPTEPEVPEEEGGGLLGVVLAVLGVMLAVVCGVLGFVFIRRRKK